MPAYYEYEHCVREDEIDPLGHANNIAYFSWMQEAAIAHSAFQGWTTEDYKERGWAWLVRTHSIEYRRPALVHQKIVVRTWVAEMTRYTSRRKYEMRHDSLLIARAETNWAFVDLNSGKLCAVPKEVSDAFEVVAA